MERLTKEKMSDSGFKGVHIYIYADTHEEALEKRKTLRAYCMNNRLWMEHEHIDEGSRDELQELVYSIRKEKGDTLLVLSYSEFGDEKESMYARFSMGVRGGYEIVSLNDPEDELTEYLVKREIETSKNRLQEIRSRKAFSGNYVGGRPPYGYYCMNRKLFIDKYESFVVKFIFYRWTQGVCVNSITKELNIRKFRNRKGNEFGHAAIQNIINNKRFYQGYYEYKGEVIKGVYSPILEETDELITQTFIKNHFDEEVEKRILKHKRFLQRDTRNLAITPYIVRDKK